ncbi:hypothetical protein AKJ29_00310 [Aliiroseovarius crassostreae]|uniref:Uncharacterized protein n=2 Tax=Aliiroseovarius crassostreae TaxID=154981 RepID=A0A0P7KH64_9RHOB|nr:hypothetical protein AKJ29_00310 [Aliiroseovarius crassostreae]
MGHGRLVRGGAINAKLHPKEVAYILDNSGASLVLVTPELGAELRKEKVADRSHPRWRERLASTGRIRPVKERTGLETFD